MKNKIEEPPKFKFKKDFYMKSRGAPAMLAVSCAHCNSWIMYYQKDGPGPLLRCYLDRIHYPKLLEKRQRKTFKKDTFPKLQCPSCQTVIGFPTIYKKENRPAYDLRCGFFSLKKIY